MGKLIVVDVEADGPIPGTDQYSMVCFGAVALTKRGIWKNTYYGETAPISNNFIPEALATSGISREEHCTFGNPKLAMQDFDKWISEIPGGKPIFISDNLAFDWQWINYYFHTTMGKNPFGYSGQRIGDKFQGFFNEPYYKWKHFRKTPADHDPVNDAIGNAEALMFLQSQGCKLF